MAIGESKGFLSFIRMPSGRAGFRIRAIEYRDNSTCFWNACLLRGWGVSQVYSISQSSVRRVACRYQASGYLIISTERYAATCTIILRRRAGVRDKLSTNNSIGNIGDIGNAPLSAEQCNTAIERQPRAVR